MGECGQRPPPNAPFAARRASQKATPRPPHGRRPPPALRLVHKDRNPTYSVVPDLDYPEVARRAAAFMEERVAAAGASGVVLGLSGGIDSAVVAHLARRALGRKCLALLMPNSDFTPDSETADGLAVAKSLGMEHETVQVGEISRLATGGRAAGSATDERAAGNLTARIRAALLYYEGQKRGYLVAGTSDRSEYLLGYFTKYGDGAADMLPIADLYKTQVRALGRHLGVPARITEKPPSPHLWPGHGAEAELGAPYGEIDAVLSWVDGGRAGPARAPAGTVERVERMMAGTEHKRRMPPAAELRACGAAPRG